MLNLFDKQDPGLLCVNWPSHSSQKVNQTSFKVITPLWAKSIACLELWRWCTWSCEKQPGASSDICLNPILNWKLCQWTPKCQPTSPEEERWTIVVFSNVTPHRWSNWNGRHLFGCSNLFLMQSFHVLPFFQHFLRQGPWRLVQDFPATVQSPSRVRRAWWFARRAETTFPFVRRVHE